MQSLQVTSNNKVRLIWYFKKHAAKNKECSAAGEWKPGFVGVDAAR